MKGERKKMKQKAIVSTQSQSQRQSESESESGSESESQKVVEEPDIFAKLIQDQVDKLTNKGDLEVKREAASNILDVILDEFKKYPPHPSTSDAPSSTSDAPSSSTLPANQYKAIWAAMRKLGDLLTANFWPNKMGGILALGTVLYNLPQEFQDTVVIEKSREFFLQHLYPCLIGNQRQVTPVDEQELFEFMLTHLVDEIEAGQRKGNRNIGIDLKLGESLIKSFCTVCGAVRVYEQLAKILHSRKDSVHIQIIVKVLYDVLSTEAAFDVQNLLQLGIGDEGCKRLFHALYHLWRNLPVALIELSLYAKADNLSLRLIKLIESRDLHINFLGELYTLIGKLYSNLTIKRRLLGREGPVLVEALEELSVLIPMGSEAFQKLRKLLELPAKSRRPTR